LTATPVESAIAALRAGRPVAVGRAVILSVETATEAMLDLLGYASLDALTGSVAMAGAITLVEPIANTIAHYFFDKGWESPRFKAWRARAASEVARVAAVDHQRVAADVARGG